MNSIKTNNIIFFKSPKPLNNNDNDDSDIEKHNKELILNDPYYKYFKNSGGYNNIDFIKVLKIDNIFDNLNQFFNEQQQHNYLGLIFTSSNSIKSFHSYLIKNDNNDMILNFKFIYIVGETSCNLFKSLFINIKSFSSFSSANIKFESNAINLSNIIINDYNNNNEENKLPLLYFCGNQRRDELPNQLINNNIKLKEIIVYKSQSSNDNKNDILNLITKVTTITSYEITWLVFFSPSGVDFVLDIINDYHQSSNSSGNGNGKLLFWDNVKVAAIGKTTENHLKINNIKVDVVSPLPNVESLYDAISNFK